MSKPPSLNPNHQGSDKRLLDWLAYSIQPVMAVGLLAACLWGSFWLAWPLDTDAIQAINGCRRAEVQRQVDAGHVVSRYAYIAIRWNCWDSGNVEAALSKQKRALEVQQH